MVGFIRFGMASIYSANEVSFYVLTTFDVRTTFQLTESCIYIKYVSPKPKKEIDGIVRWMYFLRRWHDVCDY